MKTSSYWPNIVLKVHAAVVLLSRDSVRVTPWRRARQQGGHQAPGAEMGDRRQHSTWPQAPVRVRPPATMFERLGEICATHEVYLTDLDHDEVPALFWWFPNQDDYQPPPPADETVSEKLARVSNSLKVGFDCAHSIIFSCLCRQDR